RLTSCQDPDAIALVLGNGSVMSALTCKELDTTLMVASPVTLPCASKARKILPTSVAANANGPLLALKRTFVPEVAAGVNVAAGCRNGPSAANTVWSVTTPGGSTGVPMPSASTSASSSRNGVAGDGSTLRE